MSSVALSVLLESGFIPYNRMNVRSVGLADRVQNKTRPGWGSPLGHGLDGVHPQVRAWVGFTPGTERKSKSKTK